MTIRPSEIAFATIDQLASQLAGRAISSEELTRATLDRLAAIGPAYNALAALLHDRAIQESRRADTARAAGRRTGLLAGIPYGAKDLLAARGGPTTWGTPAYAERHLDHDARAIERLTRAG